MWSRVVAGVQRHRLLVNNSLVFGSLSGLAEFSQQSLLRNGGLVLELSGKAFGSLS